MSFGTITTTNTLGVQNTWRETNSGIYILDGITFGDPQHGIKISPARKNGPNGPINFSVTTYREYVVPDTTKLSKLSVALNVSVPKEATAAQVDDGVANLSSWLTGATINELLLGRS